MKTELEFGITDGISVSLVSINVWRLAGDTLNIACNFLYCNHQVDRDVLITLYFICDNPCSASFSVIGGKPDPFPWKCQVSTVLFYIRCIILVYY
jgi:hypothetical protein